MRQRIWALFLLVALVAADVNKSILSPSQLKMDDHKNQRQQLIKTVEKSLLDIFGLSSRPRPKRNVTISNYMWSLYKKQAKINRGFTGRTANTIRCFRGEESQDSEHLKASFKFDVAELPPQESVWAAELVVYRRRINPKTSSNYRVQVFDVLSQSMDTQSTLRLIDTRVLSGQTYGAGWESFDVLLPLNRWRESPTSNHGLVVEISTNNATNNHVRLKRETHETQEQWMEFQPLLVTYSRDSSTMAAAPTLKRTRRSAKKHRRKGRKNNCGRHALYVDFSDVGWNDWIVAPPGYDAYFCYGDCPFPLADHLNATNHAIVQTLMNSVNPTAVPRACCVPTELSPISMLYVDEYEKVVLKNYQDMVVEGCGCR